MLAKDFINYIIIKKIIIINQISREVCALIVLINKIFLIIKH